MVTKLKRGRPGKQFFSELDAIIEEAEAITLGQHTSTTIKDVQRKTVTFGTRRW